MSKAGEYSIGSYKWNGLSKLIEECGEVLQVSGKIIGSGGNSNHWSGDLRQKFIEEIGDVKAAISFFEKHSFSDQEKKKIQDRVNTKTILFEKWNDDNK